MFFIFGTKAFETVVGKTKVYKCGRCHNDAAWDIVKVTKWFTFFFIPLIPYSKKYYERCPICHGMVETNKEEIAKYI